ncbi:hypothetical protein [Arthrobacter sp. efr-133-R2A-63]|uniref:hypothetical protein n=1 Tax=Arthrobacter sp. efr-133-R2A-63 TaxID=3040278 RepID=UPI00254E23B2|nr:hypothetical protein [Arthrobacter sp. efr-133-R2A-63]
MSPVPRDPAIRAARAELARAGRYYSKSDPEKVEAARRLLETNRIHKARLKEIVDAAPPITQEKVDAVAAILLLPDGA